LMERLPGQRKRAVSLDFSWPTPFAVLECYSSSCSNIALQTCNRKYRPCMDIARKNLIQVRERLGKEWEERQRKSSTEANTPLPYALRNQDCFCQSYLTTQLSFPAGMTADPIMKARPPQPYYSGCCEDYNRAKGSATKSPISEESDFRNPPIK
jgi:hypothetical protein